LKKNLRIAFWELTPPFAPAAGGIASYIQHRAHVLGGQDVEIWWANATAVARWSVAENAWVERRTFPLPRWQVRLLGRWPAWGPAWKYLARERGVDLFEFLAGLNSWLPFRAGDPGIVLQCHTSMQTRVFLNQDYEVERLAARFPRWTRRNLRLASGIIACSSEIAMLEAGLFRVHPDRITILPHAFSRNAEAGLRVRNEAGGNGAILVVGNVEYFKGLDLIVRGFGEYLRQGGSHHLEIVGCAGLQELYRKSTVSAVKPVVEQLVALHGPQKIQFLGRLGKEELARRRAAATAILCGSRFEALTMVAGEAFLTGCPLILSDRTGWRTLAARYRAARLINPYDARDIAAGLQEMEDPVARQAYRRGGDDLADYLQSPELAAKTAQFYHNSRKNSVG
jgi:glycosyltransferase involved in cell wall biosynthesis